MSTLSRQALAKGLVKDFSNVKDQHRNALIAGTGLGARLQSRNSGIRASSKSQKSSASAAQKRMVISQENCDDQLTEPKTESSELKMSLPSSIHDNSTNINTIDGRMSWDKSGSIVFV